MKTSDHDCCSGIAIMFVRFILAVSFIACSLIATSLNVCAQNPELKPSLPRVKVKLRKESSGCERGLGICFVRVYEEREGSTPVILQPSEKGIELLFDESALDETNIAEIRDGNRFQVGSDVELPDELAERLGIMGTRSLQGGFYPVQYRPPYYSVICPIR